MKLFVTRFVQDDGKNAKAFRKNVIKIKKSKDCDLVKFAFILYNLHVKLGRSLKTLSKATKQESKQLKPTPETVR